MAHKIKPEAKTFLLTNLLCIQECVQKSIDAINADKGIDDILEPIDLLREILSETSLPPFLNMLAEYAKNIKVTVTEV